MTSMTPSGIAYDDTGEGEPALVFLPGWCGSRTLFDPLCARLEGRFRTLAVDWRGHGESDPVTEDFGTAELVDDAMAVIDESGANQVVPVAVTHAGWVAIEVRRRLGPERVPGLVFIDWMVLGPPPPFLGALGRMASPETTRSTVDQVTAMWLADHELPALTNYVASVAAHSDDMFARAARATVTAFQRFRSPLDAVADLEPAPPTVHLYAQPQDPSYLDAQLRFAADHPWFQVARLDDAKSHFPTFEAPDALTERIEAFVAAVSRTEG